MSTGRCCTTSAFKCTPSHCGRSCAFRHGTSLALVGVTQGLRLPSRINSVQMDQIGGQVYIPFQRTKIVRVATKKRSKDSRMERSEGFLAAIWCSTVRKRNNTEKEEI